MGFELAPFAGKAQIEYLYVRNRYGWEVPEFSKFASLDSTIGILGELVFIPLFALLQWRESIMLILLYISPFLKHLVQGLAYEPWMYYAGSFCDLIGRYSLPVARSMASNCVDLYEQGKLMSFLAVLEALVPLIIAQPYSSLWQVIKTITWLLLHE